MCAITRAGEQAHTHALRASRSAAVHTSFQRGLRETQPRHGSDDRKVALSSTLSSSMSCGCLALRKRVSKLRVSAGRACLHLRARLPADACWQ
eukprot:4115017-Pleurochrysis_carterae.AAC.1